MGEIDLGVSSDWVLKGQGSANVVFGYSGADDSLVRPGCPFVPILQVCPWVEY